MWATKHRDSPVPSDDPTAQGWAVPGGIWVSPWAEPGSVSRLLRDAAAAGSASARVSQTLFPQHC